jgi:DNA-directed RNA polymerase specialized sigma subunit
VRAAVAALPDDERRVVMARYGLGPHARGERTHRAVGALLQIGTSTSSVIEQRAIARLRAQLSRQPE